MKVLLREIAYPGLVRVEQGARVGGGATVAGAREGDGVAEGSGAGPPAQRLQLTREALAIALGGFDAGRGTLRRTTGKLMVLEGPDSGKTASLNSSPRACSGAM